MLRYNSDSNLKVIGALEDKPRDTLLVQSSNFLKLPSPLSLLSQGLRRTATTLVYSSLMRWYTWLQGNTFKRSVPETRDTASTTRNRLPHSI